MILLYGDSHARITFKGLGLPHIIKSKDSITMHRIGRDKRIINMQPFDISSTNTYVLLYGEIDCRCQIHRQIKMGRDEDEIIRTLVSAYFDTIERTFGRNNKKVIICAVIPPVNGTEFHCRNGEIQHAYPILGSDEERVRFRKKVNDLLQEGSEKLGYTYFDGWLSDYSNVDGTFKSEMSDGNVHCGSNVLFLQRFVECYRKVLDFSAKKKESKESKESKEQEKQTVAKRRSMFSLQFS